MKALRALPLAVLAALCAAGPAHAARQVDPRPVQGAAIHSRVNDASAKPRPDRAQAAQATTRVFEDARHRPIRMSTAVAGLDLAPYAATLAGIPLHGREIADLSVEVVANDKIGQTCGSDDAAACYGADNPGHSRAGHMYIPVSDPDLVHIITHEYGHHMDNQLVNLVSLGFGCDTDADGSRRWFFARDLEDNIFNRGFDCSPATDWYHLLPELYAEDFARANGMTGWRMAVPPPSRTELDALRADISRPFRRQANRRTVSVPRDGRVRRRLNVVDWTALGAWLTVPRGRDYDLLLYEAGRRRPLIKSTHSGSTDEQIDGAFIGPGRYTLVVRSRGSGGRSRLKLAFR